MKDSDKFYKNGFIVKSYEEVCPNSTNNYVGIGRYFTWPLDICTDNLSKKLNSEAMERWFGYQDNRLQVIPDIEYLQRYIEHCKALEIDVFCLEIESFSNTITTRVALDFSEFMGYDYADVNMCESCLYDDLYVKDDYFYKYFRNVNLRLNDYGLLSTLKDMMYYLQKRESFFTETGESEDYVCPTIVRLNKVSLSEIMSKNYAKYSEL